MNHACGLLFTWRSFVDYATDVPGDECTKPGHYNQEILFFFITSVPRMISVDRGKTTVEILSITPVSGLFAWQMAKADSQKTSELSAEDYFRGYQQKNVQNLTVKYSYIDDNGLRDIFIASSLINDDKCSVRFNGYMTLSRKFCKHEEENIMILVSGY